VSDVTFGFTDSWLYEDKSVHPVHISKVIPTWFKNASNNIPNDHNFKYLAKKRTVKSCSSFMNVFDNGYVIVAPCDILLKYDSKKDLYSWEVSYEWKTMFTKQENISVHTNDQMIKYLPTDSEDKFVFKLNLPLTIFTDKGYSIMQQSVPFTYNKDWYVPYGIFDTDKIHEVNIQIIVTSDNKEILIEKGTPLALYIPIKKEQHQLNVIKIKENTSLLNRFKKYYVSLNGKFKNTAFNLRSTVNG
jgi:hypothetical protein